MIGFGDGVLMKFGGGFEFIANVVRAFKFFSVAGVKLN